MRQRRTSPKASREWDLGLRAAWIAGAGCGLAALLAGGSARALDPPKVVVTYSFERVDGGAFVQNITQTPLGLGDQRLILDAVEDESIKADVLVDTPQWVVFEYTADPVTEAIVEGPVEIVDVLYRHKFQVFTLDETNIRVTTETDNTTSFARVGMGILTGAQIVWDNDITPFQVSTTGMTTCTPTTPMDQSICDLAAPPGGWPRVEDETPEDRPLPIFSVGNDSVFGDRIVSDNLTPGVPPLYLDELDDILAEDDAQTVTWNTWHGAQTQRTFLPEPGAVSSGLAALLALGLLGWLRRTPDVR